MGLSLVDFFSPCLRYLLRSPNIVAGQKEHTKSQDSDDQTHFMEAERMIDWLELPNEVWHLIGDKLSVAAGDQIRFRSVCTTWRSLLPSPHTPWLMLAQSQDIPTTRCGGLFCLGGLLSKKKKKPPTTRGFFPLGHQQQYVVDDDHHKQVVHQFELPELYDRRCVGSTGTWLITVDDNQRMCLLNPFSRYQLNLPPQPIIESVQRYFRLTPARLRDVWLKKVIISSNPLSSDCIAMAIHMNMSKISIARPGDSSWVMVQTPHDYFEDIIFYKHQFYGINNCGILMVCNIGDGLDPPNMTLLTDGFQKCYCEEMVIYLVEWMGELLCVIKFMDLDSESYKTNRFEVRMFNFCSKKWTNLKNLGDYSLFLGFNTSVAILTSQSPGLRRNCIYFTDDYAYGYAGRLKIPGGLDMGVYDMENGNIGLHYKGMSTSFHSPPLWIIPSTTQR